MILSRGKEKGTKEAGLWPEEEEEAVCCAAWIKRGEIGGRAVAQPTVYRPPARPLAFLVRS